jgi:hypothetical protein
MRMPRIKHKSRTPIRALPFVTATKLPNIIRNSMVGLRPTAKTQRVDRRTRLIGIRASLKSEARQDSRRLRALPSRIRAVADASVQSGLARAQLTAHEAPGVIAPSISYPATDERILRQRGPRAEERSADLTAIGRHYLDIRRQWASNLGFGGLIAGSILLSPVFAFLMALAVEILIGLVADGGALALLGLVAAGAIGGFLLRELRMRQQDNPQDWT